MEYEYDHNVWMPGDGSHQSWLDAHQWTESKYEYYFIGVDLGGRKRDPSAIAVVNVRQELGRRAYIVAKLHRFSISMIYSDIATKLVKVMQGLQAEAAKNERHAMIEFAIDATGLGSPICDIIQDTFEKKGMYPTLNRVYLTGGINTTEGAEYLEYHVPKGQLISGLLAAFDSKTLFMTGQSKELAQIVTELQEFEIHITESGRDHYEDRGKGHHSDLLIALALACWNADLNYSDGPMVW
jgi:hypothetical protein